MNLPNKLTLLRIAMIPLIVAIYYSPLRNLEGYSVLNSTISLVDILVLVIFALASFTDYLDGMIARRDNLITTFGKFADPIADKLLVNTLLLLLAGEQTIPIIVPIIMISRDMIVDAIRLVSSSNNRVIAASYWGKLKTVTQMVAIIMLLLRNIPFSLLGVRVDLVMIMVATAVSLISGIDYFVKNRDIILESI
ncbi:MAG: CDP-diacylglycerol--glycerol-3-phosphate 3-phosphatidyltransferase [Erysipelotrichaceae bacterium]|nr:CDP-diacylglycerol--glycerol-3-phosphate 3-phosphatidyltransferase [Erysipelotrichaceae bacterium]